MFLFGYSYKFYRISSIFRTIRLLVYCTAKERSAARYLPAYTRQTYPDLTRTTVVTTEGGTSSLIHRELHVLRRRGYY